MDGPSDVVRGGLVGFQGRAAGERDALEPKLTAFPLFYFVDDAAAAFDAGVAKSFHNSFLLIACW